jgi:hypothetical protein
MTNNIQIHWQKIKFNHLGRQGISELVYNYINGRFESDTTGERHWDNSNWLVQQVEQPDMFENIKEECPF